jgi:hypothetical protein
MDINMETIKSNKYPLNKERFAIFRCSCFSEGLILSKYEDEQESQISIGFFQMGFHNKNILSFWERLRWMWHILITGMPWCDMIIFDNKEAIKFGETIIKFAKDEE